MNLDNSIKKKIQTAVTIALITAGIIPAAKAEVNDANVNNPSGTTIDQGLGTKAVDLDNGGTYTISNAGTISAETSQNVVYGINVDSSTTISELTNSASGTISAFTVSTSNRIGKGINGAGDSPITTLTNEGTISGRGRQRGGFGIQAVIGSFDNSGTIEGISGDGIGGGVAANTGIGVDFAEGSITTTLIKNTGTIRGLSDHAGAYGIQVSLQDVTTLDNDGTISAQADTSTAVGGYIKSDMTTFDNSGTISATAGTNNAYGVSLAENEGGEDFTVTTVNNSGTISATATSGNGAYGVYFDTDGYGGGTIVTNFNNTGTISSVGNDNLDIKLNSGGNGAITNFNNSQGKDGNDVLTYDGKLPTNYNVIVNSSSDFGQVLFSNESGTTNFGVDSSSSLSNGTTYESVISGLATAKIGATRTGTLGSYSWTLQLQDGETTIWDLVIGGSSRSSYTIRITANNKAAIASILEAINTAGSKSSLTSALDALSDTNLRKALGQIEGVTIKSIKGSGFKRHSTFKRSVSSALSSPSVNSLTRNNYASLSLNDLNLSNDQNQYYTNSFNGFDFKEMANIFKNKDLFSLEKDGSTLYVRTYADLLNQDSTNNATGYESSTYGLLVGNENNFTDEIKQGWALGFSGTDNNFDESQGDSDSKTVHAMIYQNQEFENYTLSFNIGAFLSRTEMDRKITQGLAETLNSTTNDLGFDLTGGINQSYQLENNFIITPSFSTNISYIIQDDLEETGGTQALTVDNENLLIVKPEIGFALTKQFNNTEDITRKFEFSSYVSYEDKVDGTTSKAKLSGDSSSFSIVDDNTDDTFITSGLGFSEVDKVKNVEYNLGAYLTQNNDNSLNSTLLSYNYIKKF